MSDILFVTWEIHPTTWGGCGVLLRHAATRLLRDGHQVGFLLDVTADEFRQFHEADRRAFPNPEQCRAWHVDALCEDFAWNEENIPDFFQRKSMRFAHALQKITREESFDFIEFFEYCGSSYYALARKLFGQGPETPIGVRLHNSIELIDRHESTKPLDRERFVMYGLERGAIALAEAALTPTQAYCEHYYKPLYDLPPERVVISQSPKDEFPTVDRRPGTDRFRIVYLGRVIQFKGVEQLIKAGLLLLNRRPDLNCVFDIIGQDTDQSPLPGRYIDYLKQLIPDSLRNRFEFPGHITHENLIERLNEALFGVFPNQFESFCYSLHEVYDAGVPVIINDIPGFRDFFEHGKNALVYDGTTLELVASMERMIDDDWLRERLARPYEVATDPLGDYYNAPKALGAVIEEPNGIEPEALILLLQTDKGDLEETRKALSRQSRAPARIVLLKQPDAGEAGAFVWLGKPWKFLDASGSDIDPLTLKTLGALAILQAGDQPDPNWLSLCSHALARRPRMTFAGTFCRNFEGGIVPLTVDVAPEAAPLERGSDPTRCLLRTEPDQLLVDLFDPTLGELGEIGYIWNRISEFEPGRLYPEPLLAIEDRPRPADASALAYLFARYGEPFAERLAQLGCQLQTEYMEKLRSLTEGIDRRSPRERLLDAAVERRLKEEAAASLGGKQLLKLIWKRWSTRNQRR